MTYLGRATLRIGVSHMERTKNGTIRQVSRSLDTKTYKGWFNWINYARKHKLKAYGKLYDPKWGRKW